MHDNRFLQIILTLISFRNTVICPLKAVIFPPVTWVHNTSHVISSPRSFRPDNRITVMPANWRPCLAPHCESYRHRGRTVQQFTVESRYNAVQYNIIFHTALQLSTHYLGHSTYSQKTPNISSSRTSYGVSIVRIFEEIYCVIMAPHCIELCSRRPKNHVQVSSVCCVS